MGRVLIEQPNGKVMLWSSIIDAPIAFDMTLDDYIEFKMEEARQEAIKTFNNYKRNSDYLFDLLFCYNMDYEERDELYKKLLSIGYKKEDIRDIIFGQLPERSIENEI